LNVKRIARPAVDLFLRNLTFEFGHDDVVGLPGALIGFDGPLPDERLIWFLHEAEHLTQLMYPLGTLMTAMGLRALDLRNDAARALASPPRTIPEWLQQLQAIGRHADFVILIHQFAEWVKPLLEGLALISEMELVHIGDNEVTPAFIAAVSIELVRVRQMLFATPDGQETLRALAEGDLNPIDDLRAAAEEQIRFARASRIAGDVIDDIFWSPTSGEGTLPYFIGYLFIKKLEQAWRERSPSLTPRQAYQRATVAICSALPMSFLPLCSVADIATGRPSHRAATGMQILISDLLRLSADDCRALGDHGRFFRFVSGSLTTFLDTAGLEGRDQFARLLSQVITSVFEQGEEAHLRQTASVLDDIEYAKAIVPVALREVAAVAIDEETSTLLLVDVARASASADEHSSAQLDMTAVTFFSFEADDLRVFATDIGADLARLPPVRIGAAPYRLRAGDAQQGLVLITYLHFWPEGTNRPEPLRTIRILVGTKGKMMYEAGADEEDVELRRIRDFVNVKYRDNVARAIDGQFNDTREQLERLGRLCEDTSVEDKTVDALLNIYRPETLDTVRNDIRLRLSRMLFGDEVDHAQIRGERLSVVARYLAHDDVAVLRRALRQGLVFSPDCIAPVLPTEAPAACAAVVRIRAAALRRLGFGLVRWREFPPAIELDLTETPSRPEVSES
jgi:hypothetical protein